MDNKGHDRQLIGRKTLISRSVHGITASPFHQFAFKLKGFKCVEPMRRNSFDSETKARKEGRFAANVQSIRCYRVAREEQNVRPKIHLHDVLKHSKVQLLLTSDQENGENGDSTQHL